MVDETKELIELNHEQDIEDIKVSRVKPMAFIASMMLFICVVLMSCDGHRPRCMFADTNETCGYR